jgi:hypothetical protein
MFRHDHMVGGFMKLRRAMVAAAAAAMMAAPAQAASAETAPAEDLGARARCGYYTTHIPLGADDAWYNHCGGGRICIKVDTVWRPDVRIEVGPGVRYLGTTFDVRNAWYIGLPHPTLRCNVY